MCACARACVVVRGMRGLCVARVVDDSDVSTAQVLALLVAFVNKLKGDASSEVGAILGVRRALAHARPAELVSASADDVLVHARHDKQELHGLPGAPCAVLSVARGARRAAGRAVVRSRARGL